ncbi:hypothetical protein AN958_07783 [Leucoagaricus sp. SymC.cos]|nr:hypothetical protein AN958_07783 [Leucoagaricus sp. SymC.cos]
MAQSPLHQFGASDEDDRQSRFASSSGFDNTGTGIIGRGSGTLGGGGPVSLRERAASQPPHSSDQNFLSSPSATHFIPSSLGGGTLNVPWPNSRLGSNRGNQPIPVRSSSFSTTSQSQFSSAMRDRVFPSMFEDDEDSESDNYDERYIPPALGRGRSFGDPTRSRSQSLATGRPGLIGSSYLGSSTMNSWTESGTSPLAIPGRYGEIKPPGQSRYGSLGTLGRSPSNLLSSSPSANLLGNGLSMRGISETNQSPFRRDVGQILLDDGSAFRELWAGMNPPRDENGGGGSGTTSRRHSVSVVQPRRGVVGFNAPDAGNLDEPVRTSGGVFGRGTGPKLTDDDLASDLGMLNLGSNDPPLSSSSTHPPSQPASLPIYAPLSRSPPSRDLLSPYQSINNLGMPGSYNSRQSIGTPSEHDFAAERESPSRFDQYSQYGQQQDSTARFVPGQGFKYPSTGAGNMQVPYLRNREPSFSSNAPPPGLTSPIAPTAGPGSRLISPQQQTFYPQPIQRKASEPLSPLSATSASLSQPPSASINLTNPPLPVHGGHHQQQASQGSVHSVSQQPNLNDLGKGVPLHSVPSSCPLFIVEFKAGRTDLFYLTDPSLDVNVGDLVIVEADRGKDLGTVVNDTITISQVEDWQRQQAEKANSAAIAAAAAAAIGFGLDSPLSPTGPGVNAVQGGGASGATQGAQPGKKEINPKMILGKADQNDSQLLTQKAHDEMKALQLCQSKVKAKKLPMEVIDAEYQWYDLIHVVTFAHTHIKDRDRRKLTFYFIAEKRIDFRELVRELFRLYKTRIWMASIQGGGVSYE